jgi:hypothetical protein
MPIDTLKASRQADSEWRAIEVMSGGGVRTSPRHLKISPRELKTREGIERWTGLNNLLIATDRCSDQRPEGGARGSGTGEATLREEKLGNAMRARLTDEGSRLGSGENP